MAAKAENLDVFAWEGTDRRGTRIKGESRAGNIALVKAELETPIRRIDRFSLHEFVFLC